MLNDDDNITIETIVVKEAMVYYKTAMTREKRKENKIKAKNTRQKS